MDKEVLNNESRKVSTMIRKSRRNEEHSDFDFEWEDYLSGEMGDFMRHLAKAFNQADLKNLAKLEKSFPEVYKVFAEFKGDVLHKFESKIKSENHIDYATFEDVEKGEISEDEYLKSFEYIYSSLLNGNISQYKKQLKRLLQEGRLKDYQRYLDEFGLDGKILRFLESRSRRNEEEWKNSPTAKEFSDFVEVLVDKMNLSEDEVFVNMDEMPMEVNFHKDDKKVRIEFSSEHVGAEKHLAVYVEDSEVDNFEYKPSSKKEIEKAVERVIKFIDKEVK